MVEVPQLLFVPATAGWPLGSTITPSGINSPVTATEGLSAEPNAATLGATSSLRSTVVEQAASDSTTSIVVKR
jgi:hypothetical protein